MAVSVLVKETHGQDLILAVRFLLCGGVAAVPFLPFLKGLLPLFAFVILPYLRRYESGEGFDYFLREYYFTLVLLVRHCASYSIVKVRIFSLFHLRFAIADLLSATRGILSPSGFSCLHRCGFRGCSLRRLTHNLVDCRCQSLRRTLCCLVVS